MDKENSNTGEKWCVVVKVVDSLHTLFLLP